MSSSHSLDGLRGAGRGSDVVFSPSVCCIFSNFDKICKFWRFFFVLVVGNNFDSSKFFILDLIFPRDRTFFFKFLVIVGFFLVNKFLVHKTYLFLDFFLC